MRLKLTFRPLGNKRLELDYYDYLSRLLQKFLNDVSMDSCCKIHNDEYQSENMKFNLLTFSELFCPNYDIDDYEIIVNSNVQWYISSPVKELVLDFTDHLIKNKIMKVGEAELEFVSLQHVKSLPINSSARFRCLSPICIDMPKIHGIKDYLLIDNENFKKQIKNNLVRKYYFLNNTLPENMNLDIDILNFEECSEGKCIYIKNDIVRCYMPVFEVKGSRDLINIGYEAGFGSHNGMGLGMVETC